MSTVLAQIIPLLLLSVKSKEGISLQVRFRTGSFTVRENSRLTSLISSRLLWLGDSVLKCVLRSNVIGKSYNVIFFNFQYKDESESGLNLDELSDEEEENDDEISLASNLSAEAADNVKAISVENAFMEVIKCLLVFMSNTFWGNMLVFICLNYYKSSSVELTCRFDITLLGSYCSS
jgi:hypothetical protein